MSTLTERLRSIVRPGCGANPSGSPGEPERLAPQACFDGETADSDAIADFLDGEWRESAAERYLVIDRAYPPGHRHGRVAVADSAPGIDGYWPALSVLDPRVTPTRMLFVDLETTGLAGGAGTYAFLVGCGWFDGATFRIRQFLLVRYAAERRLLEAVAETAMGIGAVVTYNGKTFDLPLIETRFLFHRMATPFAGLPHVDMLHAARRLWSGGPASRASSGGSAWPDPPYVRRPGPAAATGSADPATSCRLAVVEQSVLGHIREDDVAGYEIPSRYFQYVRSGDVRPLAAVVEHNRLDLLSVALLTARAAHLLERGAGEALTAREALGLGRLYARAGRLPEAQASFARSAAMAGGDETSTAAEAWHAYAVSLRRDRRYEEAAAAWARLLDIRSCPERLALAASEALAVHHEHRDRNLPRAYDFARWSLRYTTTPGRVHAAHHRLARLDRKLARPDPKGSDIRANHVAALF